MSSKDILFKKVNNLNTNFILFIKIKILHYFRVDNILLFNFSADKPFPVFRSTSIADPSQTSKNENEKLKTEDQRAGNFLTS